MADHGVDYSGRPARHFRADEIAGDDTTDLPIYDVIVVLEDGREAARIDGVLYPLSEAGAPDFEHPIDA